MFNVGDVVEIAEQSSATGMLDFVKGKGYEVMATNANHWHSQLVQLKDESGAEGWFHCAHFKLKETYESVKKKECLFRKGQTAYDVLYGKGVVVDIVKDDTYPVTVQFDCEAIVMAFTEDGKTHESYGRTLYFSEPKIEAATEPVFEPTLKKGDVVVLSDKEADYIANVVSEDEGSVYYKTADGVVTYVDKNSVIVYRLGEKINFK